MGERAVGGIRNIEGKVPPLRLQIAPCHCGPVAKPSDGDLGEKSQKVNNNLAYLEIFLLEMWRRTQKANTACPFTKMVELEFTFLKGL